MESLELLVVVGGSVIGAPVSTCIVKDSSFSLGRSRDSSLGEDPVDDIIVTR